MDKDKDLEAQSYYIHSRAQDEELSKLVDPDLQAAHPHDFLDYMITHGNNSPTINLPCPQLKIATSTYLSRHVGAEDAFPYEYFADDLPKPQQAEAVTYESAGVWGGSDIPLKWLLAPGVSPRIGTENQYAIDWRAGEFAHKYLPPQDFTATEKNQYMEKRQLLLAACPPYEPGFEPPPPVPHGLHQLEDSRLMTTKLLENINKQILLLQAKDELSKDETKLLTDLLKQFNQLGRLQITQVEKFLTLSNKFPIPERKEIRPNPSFLLENERYIQKRIYRFVHEKGFISKESAQQLRYKNAEQQSIIEHLAYQLQIAVQSGGKLPAELNPELQSAYHNLAILRENPPTPPTHAEMAGRELRERLMLHGRYSSQCSQHAKEIGRLEHRIRKLHEQEQHQHSVDTG